MTFSDMFTGNNTSFIRLEKLGHKTLWYHVFVLLRTVYRGFDMLT